jgi:hypothetical protein
MNQTHPFGVACADDFEYADQIVEQLADDSTSGHRGVWKKFKLHINSILSHRKPDHSSADCCSSWNQTTSGCLRRPYTDTTTSYPNTKGGVKSSQIIPGMIDIQSPKSIYLTSYRSFPCVINTEGGVKSSHIIPWMIRRVPNPRQLHINFPFWGPYAAPDFPRVCSLYSIHDSRASPPPVTTTHSYKYFSSNRVWTDSWSSESQITHQHMHQFAHYKSKP